MKPSIANLINSLILIAIGLWSYFGSETSSFTALIPVITGAILLAMYPSMNKGNRIVAHIVVVLTFLILVAFYMPLSGALERGDNLAVTRVIIMMASSAAALIVFIKSFIDARRKS